MLQRQRHAHLHMLQGLNLKHILIYIPQFLSTASMQ